MHWNVEYYISFGFSVYHTFNFDSSANAFLPAAQSDLCNSCFLYPLSTLLVCWSTLFIAFGSFTEMLFLL